MVKGVKSGTPEGAFHITRAVSDESDRIVNDTYGLFKGVSLALRQLETRDRMLPAAMGDKRERKPQETSEVVCTGVKNIYTPSEPSQLSLRSTVLPRSMSCSVPGAPPSLCA